MSNKEFIKEILYSLKNFPDDWESTSGKYDIRHKNKDIGIIETDQNMIQFFIGECNMCISGKHPLKIKNYCTRRKLRKAIRKMKRNNIINNLYNETN